MQIFGKSSFEFLFVHFCVLALKKNTSLTWKWRVQQNYCSRVIKHIKVQIFWEGQKIWKKHEFFVKILKYQSKIKFISNWITMLENWNRCSILESLIDGQLVSVEYIHIFWQFFLPVPYRPQGCRPKTPKTQWHIVYCKLQVRPGKCNVGNFMQCRHWCTVQWNVAEPLTHSAIGVRLARPRSYLDLGKQNVAAAL